MERTLGKRLISHLEGGTANPGPKITGDPASKIIFLGPVVFFLLRAWVPPLDHYREYRGMHNNNNNNANIYTG